MNIFNQLFFRAKGDKSSVLSLRKLPGTSVLAIGLEAGQIMPRHQTNTDAFLILMRGKVSFQTEESQTELRPGDLHEIPPGVPHEVAAYEASTLLLFRME